ncbi:MAG: hypothetical protein MZW92_15485 [Comamonadaceae bacterium]|nr:hypothetical protein [Comamonadaceae bacterium]
MLGELLASIPGLTAELNRGDKRRCGPVGAPAPDHLRLRTGAAAVRARRWRRTVFRERASPCCCSRRCRCA